MSEVSKVGTPWAQAFDHVGIVVNMDAILAAAGVGAPHVRRRLTAHAIIACGWRQSCQNFNAWKVKLGARRGAPFFVSSTQEEVDGKLVVEHGTRWRSYGSFAEALRDHPVFNVGRYHAARAALVSAAAGDGDYWEDLGKAGYYTDTHNVHPADFAGLCARVSRTLAGVGEGPGWAYFFDLYMDGIIGYAVGGAT